MRWLLLLSTALCAYYQPWLPELFQPELDLGYTFEEYPSSTNIPQNVLHGGWVSLGISPWFNWYGQIDGAAKWAKDIDEFFFDYIRFTAKYNVLDEWAGDCVTLTFGGSIAVPSGTSRRELGTPHLGQVDLELFGSVGYCGFWAAGAVVGSRWGPPTLKGIFGVEKFVYKCHRLAVGLAGRVGLDDNPLTPNFQGYAPIKTRAGEVWAKYRYCIPIWGQLVAEYNYRFYAKNFPKNAHNLLIGIHYPISLG